MRKRAVYFQLLLYLTISMFVCPTSLQAIEHGLMFYVTNTTSGDVIVNIRPCDDDPNMWVHYPPRYMYQSVAPAPNTLYSEHNFYRNCGPLFDDCAIVAPGCTLFVELDLLKGLTPTWKSASVNVFLSPVGDAIDGKQTCVTVSGPAVGYGVDIVSEGVQVFNEGNTYDVTCKAMTADGFRAGAQSCTPPPPEKFFDFMFGDSADIYRCEIVVSAPEKFDASALTGIYAANGINNIHVNFTNGKLTFIPNATPAHWGPVCPIAIYSVFIDPLGWVYSLNVRTRRFRWCDGTNNTFIKAFPFKLNMVQAAQNKFIFERCDDSGFERVSGQPLDVKSVQWWNNVKSFIKY